MTGLALGVLAGSALLVAYTYAGYPLLLMALAALRRRYAAPPPPEEWPRVSITIPAYNEADSIGGTLEQILAIDYPPERRQVLVVSDASTDGTDQVVRGYADRGVELLRVERRGGKTAAENAARGHLRGDIIVNTDASVRIRRDALKPLVAALADPEVGVASGRDVSVARLEDTANVGESGYVGYEMWVRRLETGVLGIVGASGCFYAIRAHLHATPVPDALSRDFAAALIARQHGLRAVSVDQAVCYVPRTSSLKAEYRRKVRTMARGMETLAYMRRLLNPVRYDVFAWMLVSHKVCRWLVPWALAAALLALTALAPSSRWAAGLSGAAALILLLAAAGWLWPQGRSVPRLLALPAFLVAGNLAAMHAAFQALRRESSPLWEPTRRGAVETK
jgi:cellulose synthase/poly-beta-1,6-N-acetylglucosamine synthase-like glycosyltransferase